VKLPALCDFQGVLKAATLSHLTKIALEFMDSFDQKILQALSENARQSVSSIAEQVNLSRSAVSERIKRMEDSGEIQGYRVMRRKSEDALILVWFELRHSMRAEAGFCDKIVQFIRTLEGIQECYAISGDLDMLIKAEASSMQALEQLRAQLDQFPGVKQLITHVVLREWTDFP
jgi:DNA-binding Lrp family transcriptional regulator